MPSATIVDAHVVGEMADGGHELRVGGASESISLVMALSSFTIVGPTSTRRWSPAKPLPVSSTATRMPVLDQLDASRSWS